MSKKPTKWNRWRLKGLPLTLTWRMRSRFFCWHDSVQLEVSLSCLQLYIWPHHWQVDICQTTGTSLHYSSFTSSSSALCLERSFLCLHKQCWNIYGFRFLDSEFFPEKGEQCPNKKVGVQWIQGKEYGLLTTCFPTRQFFSQRPVLCAAQKGGSFNEQRKLSLCFVCRSTMHPEIIFCWSDLWAPLLPLITSTLLVCKAMASQVPRPTLTHPTVTPYGKSVGKPD